MALTPPLPRALHAPQNYRVLYVDMNSFFASVEQQDHPELRDKPVAVVSHIHPRGTVLAASYPAKAYGIKTGMKLREACNKAPSLITRTVHPFRYKQVHEEIMDLLRSIFGPGVHPKSIDEAVIYLPSNWQSAETSLALAEKFKSALAERLGSCITCSIGIAPNRLLGKLATELKKPNGLTVIALEDIPGVMNRIELTDLNGIASRSAATLIRHGITTPLELYETPEERLRTLFGAWGQYWWWRLHGFECDGHQTETMLKSMSHEHVLTTRISTAHELRSMVAKMADKLCYRLQRNHLQCRHIGMYLRFANIVGLSREHHLDAPTSTAPHIMDRFTSLIADMPETLPDGIKKITLFMNGLSEGSGYQPNLWEPTRTKAECVAPALSLVRSKHGYTSICTASALTRRARGVHAQLGFGRIGDSGNLE